MTQLEQHRPITEPAEEQVEPTMPPVGIGATPLPEAPVVDRVVDYRENPPEPVARPEAPSREPPVLDRRTMRQQLFKKAAAFAAAKIRGQQKSEQIQPDLDSRVRQLAATEILKKLYYGDEQQGVQAPQQAVAVSTMPVTSAPEPSPTAVTADDLPPHLTQIYQQLNAHEEQVAATQQALTDLRSTVTSSPAPQVEQSAEPVRRPLDLWTAQEMLAEAEAQSEAPTWTTQPNPFQRKRFVSNNSDHRNIFRRKQ